MLVKFYDIEWDTKDDDGVVWPPEQCGLPRSCTVEMDDLDELEDFDEAAADTLSDLYGYCVWAFRYEILEGSDQPKTAPTEV